ncbi:sulfotransferase family 2 domain-containing protein [Puniceibacterium confluentis]|uniref:sulfotransferase family 2 domain-containing protein n=1 Tax=Puniceibacterium confluentis TaxID=1958944 RepID=UPI0011B76DE3|nr:sulfotransferase family 2 domain-containing protein [Puniceibacterium confluentis]
MVIAITAHKIAYMALPKAGCSSVKAALARLDPDVTLPPKSEIGIDTWHGIYPTQRFRPHRWQEYPDYFRFAVVRDPVRRLISAYTNRVVDLKELHNCRKILRGRIDLPKDPDPDFFFSNLSAYCEASSVIKHHCLGAELFLGPKPMRYDRIYRTEEMGDLARDLTRISGRKVTLARANKSMAQLELDDLKYGTVRAIRDFLNTEYRYLSGYYDNPL